MGLDDLSDEQVLPFLLVMDPDTLLNFGKTSQRFFNLVCDREVWRQLLKKTAEFTEEKVEQLRAFKGNKGSVEMMPPEMVKESASRIPFSLKPMPVLEFGVLEEEDARWLRGIKNQVKVTLTVEGGWSKDSFEVDCNGLEELSTLAKATGVKLILVEACETLRPFPTFFSDIIRPHPKISIAWKVVVAHVEQQEVMLEKVKINNVGILPREDLGEFILPLIRRSKRWKIERIEVLGVLDLFWSNLAKVPTFSGHIGHIHSLPDPKRGSRAPRKHLNTLRNLWDICERILTYTSPGLQSRNFLGGKVPNLDIEAEWQRVLDTLDVF